MGRCAVFVSSFSRVALAFVVAFVSSGGVVSSRLVRRLVGALRLAGRLVRRCVRRSVVRSVFPLRLVGRLVVIRLVRRLVYWLLVSVRLVSSLPRSSPRRVRAFRLSPVVGIGVGVSYCEAMGFVACFLLYPHTRRFSQLRFPSVWGVACPDPPLGCGVSFLVPLRHRSCLLPCVPSSARIGVSPVGSSCLAVGRLVSSISSRRVVSVRRQACFRLLLFARAVFVSSIIRRFLIAIVNGRRRLFHTAHRGDGRGYG